MQAHLGQHGRGVGKGFADAVRLKQRPLGENGWIEPGCKVQRLRRSWHRVGQNALDPLLRITDLAGHGLLDALPPIVVTQLVAIRRAAAVGRCSLRPGGNLVAQGGKFVLLLSIGVFPGTTFTLLLLDVGRIVPDIAGEVMGMVIQFGNACGNPVEKVAVV